MESDKEIGLLKSIFHIWSSEKNSSDYKSYDIPYINTSPPTVASL